MAEELPLEEGSLESLWEGEDKVVSSTPTSGGSDSEEDEFSASGREDETWEEDGGRLLAWLLERTGEPLEPEEEASL